MLLLRDRLSNPRFDELFGELSRGEFDKRIALMEQMRARGPGTHVIDAGKNIDEVSALLFELIWKAL